MHIVSIIKAKYIGLGLIVNYIYPEEKIDHSDAKLLQALRRFFLKGLNIERRRSFVCTWKGQLLINNE